MAGHDFVAALRARKHERAALDPSQERDDRGFGG
jgi:hypothetical protein